MNAGFVITRLSLLGDGLKSAEVTFTRGLNVISGPSDTGKTFIAQCVDFMMGSTAVPKDIDEARGYQLVQMELEANADGKRFVLQRGLRGGNAYLLPASGPHVVLSAKHRAGEQDSISTFLLELSGLRGSKIRTNQRGSVRELSFRDVAHLVLVDEESVISDQSPVFAGNVYDKTTEGSVFRLLVTGVDGGAVIEREDPKILRGRQAGKIEILERLLGRARAQTSERELQGGLQEKREQLTRLEQAIAEAQAAVDTEQASAAEAEESRRSAWKQLREVESRLDVLTELQKRFDLLRVQYESDLRRLGAIAEAGSRLEQMREERCPVCGALAEHHSAAHHGDHSTPTAVVEACRAEAAKTQKLMRDLDQTISENTAEVERLTAQRAAQKARLSASTSSVIALLQPKLQQAVQRLRKTEALREAIQRDIETLEQISELEQLLNEATARQPASSREFVGPAVSSGLAEKFSKHAEDLLRAWHFPGLTRVTFSEQAQDLVISGRARGSHGKGVRAITRAAFNLALLRLCIEEEKPFPGLLLIDSPLVVYREPEAAEAEFPVDVKESFYRTVAEEFQAAQVIVLENDDPPQDVRAKANVILFTGNDTGRRGFIPTAATGR
jgi:hypothetical protein